MSFEGAVMSYANIAGDLGLFPLTGEPFAFDGQTLVFPAGDVITGADVELVAEFVDISQVDTVVGRYLAKKQAKAKEAKAKTVVNDGLHWSHKMVFVVSGVLFFWLGVDLVFYVQNRLKHG